MTMENRIKAARGQLPADLLIKNCRLVNVLSGEIHPADVAVYDGVFLGFGNYQAQQVIEADNRYLCPGFIDGHIHIESSLLSPVEFAKTAARHGTAAVICDPHEICNVLGVHGLEYMLGVTEALPLAVYCQVPSCVPATHLESAGGSIPAEVVAGLLQKYPRRILGLAEMMNFPGVLMQDPEVLAKLHASRDLVIDGHCPQLSGEDLNAYILAGPGSEHEASTEAEAREKLRKGMHLFLRQGSSGKNLLDLLPVLNSLNAAKISIVTDDLHADDLLHEGHLDHCLRLAVQAGVDPVRAVQMLSINTAGYFGLKRRGAVAPGYRADCMLLNDLKTAAIESVFLQGRPLREADFHPPSDAPLQHSCILGAVTAEQFAIPAPHPPQKARCLELIPGQILTRARLVQPKIRSGLALPDPEQDLAKLAVLERHQGSGNIGLGFVRGLGLQAGALASTVAHDSHNLILAGTNDADLLLAAETIQAMQGGCVAVRQGEVLAALPLPIAGLMSDLDISEVVDRLSELNQAAARLGCPPNINPFMLLSFLALPVIPELRLTDQGLVDVRGFDFTPLWTDEP